MAVNDRDKINKSPGKIRGDIKVTFTSFIVFSIGFLPTVIFARFILYFISFDQTWHFLVLPFLIYIAMAITLFYQVLISGLVIHVFNLKYKPGLYKYNYTDKMALKWIYVCALYTPIRKILEIFSVGGMKIRYYRLLGMKIGDNTLVGGTIMDPCLTEFGNNCTMGLYAVIYGHIHDYEKGTIYLDKIRIGNNCIIGAGALVMPGAVLEDGVKLATGAVVTKGQFLKKGKTYAGIPATEIKPKKSKK